MADSSTYLVRADMALVLPETEVDSKFSAALNSAESERARARIVAAMAGVRNETKFLFARARVVAFVCRRREEEVWILALELEARVRSQK